MPCIMFRIHIVFRQPLLLLALLPRLLLHIVQFMNMTLLVRIVATGPDPAPIIAVHP